MLSFWIIASPISVMVFSVQNQFLLISNVLLFLCFFFLRLTGRLQDRNRWLYKAGYKVFVYAWSSVFLNTPLPLYIPTARFPPLPLFWYCSRFLQEMYIGANIEWTFPLFFHLLTRRLQDGNTELYKVRYTVLVYTRNIYEYPRPRSPAFIFH